MIGRFGLLVVALLCMVSTVAGEDPKPAQLNELTMYVPTPQLRARFGNDIIPLTAYIKALERRASEILAKEDKPEAKGLLIAVGIKSRKSTRIWCEAVEGAVPQGLLQRIERELAKIEAVDLKKGPAGFAMKVELFGRKPEKYPEFPQSWVEATKKERTMLIPPDELFMIIWPDKV